MSFTMTSTVRKVRDHFEPEVELDPQEQRALRAHLEQIDYAAFAANREILAKAVGTADLARFQRMAVATANARARWVATAIAMSQKPEVSPQEVSQLTTLRCAFEELTEAYDALRRMVERGYLAAKPKA
jgi:hypothetical protein